MNERLGGIKGLTTFSSLASDETIADAEYTLETLILEADGMKKRNTDNGYIGSLRKFKP